MHVCACACVCVWVGGWVWVRVCHSVSCHMSVFMQVCAYNRTTEKVDHFLANEAKGEP